MVSAAVCPLFMPPPPSAQRSKVSSPQTLRNKPLLCSSADIMFSETLRPERGRPVLGSKVTVMPSECSENRHVASTLSMCRAASGCLRMMVADALTLFFSPRLHRWTPVLRPRCRSVMAAAFPERGGVRARLHVGRHGGTGWKHAG